VDAKGVTYISISFACDTLMLGHVHQKPYQATPDFPQPEQCAIFNHRFSTSDVGHNLHRPTDTAGTNRTSSTLISAETLLPTAVWQPLGGCWWPRLYGLVARVTQTTVSSFNRTCVSALLFQMFLHHPIGSGWGVKHPPVLSQYYRHL